ncbi:hypothetical protein CKO51_13080 [Rhodopirellula sp. SM50]|nr:2OG-Fe(II) oxygenase [Rhodopirellula sp. SM50]PAY19061.1 hypothetical protein CKO51_13080 [Rhodopirellula sp. SM50]
MNKERLAGEDVFSVADFLSTNECDEFIHWSESLGYEPSMVSTPDGAKMNLDWRNNMRVIVDNDTRAEWLWKRAEPFVPDTIADWQPIGLNERLRFYRYDPGEQFDWHSDGCFIRDNGDRSFLTFLVYLSEDCTGGETLFSDNRVRPQFGDFSVAPQTGKALFFEHTLLHKGERVTTGRKYVLRSDVMYRKRAE